MNGLPTTKVLSTQHGMPFNHILAMLALAMTSILAGVWLMKDGSRVPVIETTSAVPDPILKLMERQTVAMEAAAQELALISQAMATMKEESKPLAGQLKTALDVALKKLEEVTPVATPIKKGNSGG
jgi:hypothetical protein